MSQPIWTLIPRHAAADERTTIAGPEDRDIAGVATPRNHGGNPLSRGRARRSLTPLHLTNSRSRVASQACTSAGRCVFAP